jgi:RNA polymerase sigma factor (sigma-70 family)
VSRTDSLLRHGETGSMFTDEQLMERLQQGQTDALDELYKRYAKRLYAFCYHATRSKDPPDAEDLVQDVFVRVIKAAHTFRPGRASFRTWVFSIARNRCIDAMRRKGRVRFLPMGRRAEQDDPEEAFVDEDKDVARSVMRSVAMEAIRECIGELANEDEKQAIVLYYLAGQVYREIGDVLGKSTSMARKHVKSAQDKVRRCLEQKGINQAL